MKIQMFLSSITTFEFFIAGLGVWRMCSLVSNEGGPFHVFERFRKWCSSLCKKNWLCREFHLDELVECEWCNSAWIGGATVLLWMFIGDSILILHLIMSLSAVAVFIKFIIQNLEGLQKLLTKLSS